MGAVPAPLALAAYILGAYFFTSSTSFANPAVTIARTLSDTFAGIAPSSVIPFVVAQFVGAALAVATVRVLWPGIEDVAHDVVVPQESEVSAHEVSELEKGVRVGSQATGTVPVHAQLGAQSDGGRHAPRLRRRTFRGILGRYGSDAHPTTGGPRDGRARYRHLSTGEQDARPNPSKAKGTEEEQLGVYRQVRDAIRERIEHELLTKAAP